MLGVTATGKNTLAKLVDIVRAFPHVRRSDLAVSIGVIVIVLAARAVARKIPGLLIAVIVAIGVSRAADLAGRGVAVVGPVPRGLPHLGLPALGWHDAAALLGAAVSMSVVILAQSAATSGAYAVKYEEPFRKTPTWSAWAPPTWPPRSPARSLSTEARPRRRWSTARAGAASWPSSRPPWWS
jgi:sulfate permease, SulP family